MDFIYRLYITYPIKITIYYWKSHPLWRKLIFSRMFIHISIKWCAWHCWRNSRALGKVRSELNQTEKEKWQWQALNPKTKKDEQNKLTSVTSFHQQVACIGKQQAFHQRCWTKLEECQTKVNCSIAKPKDITWQLK